MPKCITCGSHYFTSPYNETKQCYACVDVDEDFIDEEYEVEIDQLVNPSGKVRACIEDDNDSHGL